MGNGPVGGDGSTQLVYTISNIKRDEVCQSEDTVALPDGGSLKSVFFSDDGNPCIYDSAGVLLVLLHWRTPGQARWVPLLDTTRLDRLADGKKEESYWPVAVAEDKFHCIILKGGDQYPYFPKPLLSEFDFKVPISADTPAKSASDYTDTTIQRTKLEETFVRETLLLNLLEDHLLATSQPSTSQRASLSRRSLEVDKTVLQLLNVECREGEERGPKALELVELMRDRSGRMLEAAGKVAARYERGVLGEKIREVSERRLAGLEGGEGGEEDEMAL